MDKQALRKQIREAKISDEKKAELFKKLDTAKADQVVEFFNPKPKPQKKEVKSEAKPWKPSGDKKGSISQGK